VQYVVGMQTTSAMMKVGANIASAACANIVRISLSELMMIKDLESLKLTVSTQLKTMYPHTIGYHYNITHIITDINKVWFECQLFEHIENKFNLIGPKFKVCFDTKENRITVVK